MFAPLGKAVMGGLALSTLLTLFVVPLFYTYVEDFGRALGRLVALGSGTEGRVPLPHPKEEGGEVRTDG